MDCGESKSGWNVLQDALALYLVSKQIESDPSYRNYYKKGNHNFFIIPLCEIEELRGIRKTTKDYDSPVILLISDKDEKPYRYNVNLRKKDREELFGNPEFGNISQAILCGEMITMPIPEDSLENPKSNCTFQNIVNVNDEKFPENLDETLKTLMEAHVTDGNNIHSCFGKFNQMFYDTFVEYYFPERIDLRPSVVTHSEETGLVEILEAMTSSKFIEKYEGSEGEDKKKTAFFEKLSLIDTHNVKLLMTWTDLLYCYINGIDYNSWIHRVEHEYFRAPIPFPLHELISAKNYVEGILHKHGSKKRIKLLLIDNRLDKVRPTIGGVSSGLIEALFHEGIGTLFELRMLGSTEPYSRENTQKVFGQPDKFDSENFKNALREIITGKLLDTHLASNYAWQVYAKIKEANFVLLDFFLNNENTYLAFDFIKDICEIKKYTNDYSTTWFFITSAVYDSVVKYSQSGLLAEYYESAVVSAGDDPTNKKRQIIFIYKLLSFIKARLATFDRYKTSIENKIVMEQSSGRQKLCQEYNPKSFPPCNKEKCLQNLQTHLKKYLTEFDDVCSIFYGTSKSEITDKIKAIIESLDNLINQFIWLPETDWYIIQHQIDFIDEKLKKINSAHFKRLKFSCRYIIAELNKRSDDYSG